MKLRHIMWILAAIVAVTAMAAGVAVFINRYLNHKKDVDYIQILIPVYDKNGNKLGDAMANCNNLKKGETWRFKAMASRGFSR